jgi:hypothetical protein
MRDIAEKRQEREEAVAAAAVAPEVACRGSAAAAAVSSAIHRAKAPVPPASPAKFRAAAAPDAAVGSIDAAEAVVDHEDAAARAAAEAAKRRTVTLNRASTFSGTWGFSNGAADALTISVSASVAVSGISLCKWNSGSSTGNVDVYVIEGPGTSGRVLAHRLLPDVVLNTGGVVPLMLEQPVQLAPDTDYTLVLRMQGDMSHEHVSAAQSSTASTTSAGAPFTLTIKHAVINGPSPNLNESNSTDASSGQIPSIFLSC